MPEPINEEQFEAEVRDEILALAKRHKIRVTFPVGLVSTLGGMECPINMDYRWRARIANDLLGRAWLGVVCGYVGFCFGQLAGHRVSPIGWPLATYLILIAVCAAGRIFRSKLWPDADPKKFMEDFSAYLVKRGFAKISNEKQNDSSD